MSRTEQNPPLAADKEARDLRRKELHQEWESLIGRTKPADRDSAERALRRFYDDVGYLGPLRSVVWVESFRGFGECIQALEQQFCWFLLYQEVLGGSRPDNLAGQAIWDMLPKGKVLIGSQMESSEEDVWENQEPREVFNFADKKSHVPMIYSSRCWANVIFEAEFGERRASSATVCAAEALRHCAAFFPGPSVAICCDFPASIEIREMLPSGESFGVVTARSGEKHYGTPWGPVRDLEKWQSICNWRMLTASSILDLSSEFRRPVAEGIGLRRIMEKAHLPSILELPDHDLRRELIESISAEAFLKRNWQEGGQVFRIGEPDDYGRLLSVPIPDDEDYRAVEVLNSTPEPDGSFKNYYLRVPPDMQSAREAVAWTFDMEETEYDPFAQT
jgi:hypothetical protein